MRDERDLRGLFALIRQRVPEERGGCPPVELLVAAATRRDNQPDRLGMLEHVAECPACRREFDLLRTVVDARVNRWWLIPVVPLGAVTLLALAIWSGRRLSDPEAVAGPEHTPAPYPGVPRTDSVHLAWRAVDGAARYKLEVFSPAGQLLATAETRETTLTLPLASTLQGEDTRPMVRAYLPDGRVIGTPVAALRHMQ